MFILQFCTITTKSSLPKVSIMALTCMTPNQKCRKVFILPWPGEVLSFQMLMGVCDMQQDTWNDTLGNFHLAEKGIEAAEGMEWMDRMQHMPQDVLSLALYFPDLAAYSCP